MLIQHGHEREAENKVMLLKDILFEDVRTLKSDRVYHYFGSFSMERCLFITSTTALGLSFLFMLKALV